MFASSRSGSGRLLLAVGVLASLSIGASCSKDDPHHGGPTCDEADAAAPDFDGGLECSFPCLVAHEGDPAGGDTYASFAAPFFETYCIRCHSTERTVNCFNEVNPTCRSGAPFGANWNDPASIRTHIAHIRDAVAVGEDLFMPPDLPTTPDPSKPAPTCEERYRIARWIDSGAPGLP